MVRRHVNISLSEKAYEELKTKAKSHDMSMSSYINLVLSKSSHSECEQTVCFEDSFGDRCVIRFSGTDAAFLKQRAHKMGLTPTAYVREMLIRREMTTLSMDMNSTYDLLDLIAGLKSEISCFINSINTENTTPDDFCVENEIHTALLVMQESFERYFDGLVKLKKETEKVF